VNTDQSTGSPDRVLRHRVHRRAGYLVLTGVLVAAVLATTIGAGYSVVQPHLSDGSAYLAKGHTIAHVNGETGKSDAELARQLSTGTQRLESVPMPDGRVAVVNNDTGEVSFFDPSTMALTGEQVTRPNSKTQIQTLPTQTRGYLVDQERDTIEVIDETGRPGKPVSMPEGIEAAVPAGNSVWVVTGKGEVAEIVDGNLVRSFPVGAGPRISVADGQPVAVTENGTAYTLDGEQPRSFGETGLPRGSGAVLGSWQGSGRYLVGVDRTRARVVALDPRTGTRVAVDLRIPENTHPRFGAPVVLGEQVYVPDYAGPSLWQVDLTSQTAKVLPVPGAPGQFELKVSGGRVWANSQFDQRALVIDGAGATRSVDKGPGVGVTDSERNLDPGEPEPSPTTAPEPSKPIEPPVPTPAQEPEKAPEKTVVVPSFAKGTRYQDACTRLARLELPCEPVAAGDAAGLGPDEVIDTTPAAGSRIPAHTRVLVRYVGPLDVPDVTGLDEPTACAKITASGLRCGREVDSTPAAAQQNLLVVHAQQPQAGQQVDKGDTVTIHYPDSIALPAFAGKLQGEACGEIQTALRMTCSATVGVPPAGQCPAAGTVFGQNPAAGTVARVGSTVRVDVCDGQVTVPDWINPKPKTATTVCAAVTSQGLRCQVVEGVSAAGTGFQPGVAYDQAPKPGTQIDITATVTITYYSDKSTIGVFTGSTVDAACAAVQQANLVCNPVADLSPQNERTVIAQDQPAGTYTFGTTITVHYSGWQSVVFRIYSTSTDKKIWLMRPDGATDIPSGTTSYVVGRAFPGGTAIPGRQDISEFVCNSTCSGVAGNRFYSHLQSWGNYTTYPNAAVFMTCGASGTKQIYRVWRDVNGQRLYGITDNPADTAVTPRWEDSEALGCVWPA
jgi:beta-lactam-binding protein with PASTA domain